MEAQLDELGEAVLNVACHRVGGVELILKVLGAMQSRKSHRSEVAYVHSSHVVARLASSRAIIANYSGNKFLEKLKELDPCFVGAINGDLLREVLFDEGFELRFLVDVNLSSSNPAYFSDIMIGSKSSNLMICAPFAMHR